MAISVIQVVPQAIMRATREVCFICTNPALIAMKAAVARHQHLNLSKKVVFSLNQNDVVHFGACNYHSNALIQLRLRLQNNDYYFTAPK